MARRILAAAAISLALMAGWATSAAARPRGPELICSLAGSFNFAIAGKRAISCIFYRSDETVEFYVGSSSDIGVDLGTNNARRIAFKVAGADPEQPAALAGHFVGAQAGATLGFGLSGEALIGGATGQVALVPFRNEDDTGINFNVAVGIFDLHYAGSERRTLHERY